MTEREALKLALKALESLLDSFERCEAGYPQHIEMRFAVRDTARIAIDRATEALAQPEQEPVIDKSAAVRIATALGWTPQRTWVGLTPQERDEINEQVYGAVPHHVAFHAAIEAKLKEKNT